MNRTRKKTGRACLSLLVIVMLMSVLCPAALADTDGTEPQLTQQPDQLILQLGTRWAGVEFELRTDAGVFPAPIVVDSSGVLTMDLGGSKTYTLSCSIPRYLSQIRSRGKARLYRSRLSRHKTPLRMWRSRKNLMQTQAASQSAR